MRRCLVQTAHLLGPRTILTTGDYTSVLAACTPRDLVYLDPPYQGVCGPRDARYLPPFRHDEFCRALAGLNARGIRYIVSCDGRTGAKAFGEPAAPAAGSVCRTVHAGHAAGPHRRDL